MAASAAYWICSAADEIVVTPSGSVGSIGVIAAHEDISKALDKEGIKVTLMGAGKYKTEANPFEPLSDAAKQELQGRLNEFYGMFTKAVGRNRGVGAYAVQNGFGEGRMVSAQQAVKEGMADRVATLDATLARFLGVRTGKGLSPAAERSLRRRELELLQ
jgi:capsid assembly protease